MSEENTQELNTEEVPAAEDQSKTTVKVKQCLCVKPEEFVDKLPFIEARTFMMDRSIVDDPNNVDPTILQLIPIAIFFLLNDDRQITHIFTYKRPATGGEGRLYGKSSTNVGGHIDQPVSTNLINLIVDELLREVQEELGFQLDLVIPLTEIFHGVQTALLSSNTIYAPETDVDKVHLGIPLFFALSFTAEVGNNLLEPNPEEILDWKFEPVEEAIARIDEFETWGKVILNALPKKNEQLQSEQVQEQSQVSENG